MKLKGNCIYIAWIGLFILVAMHINSFLVKKSMKIQKEIVCYDMPEEVLSDVSASYDFIGKEISKYQEFIELRDNISELRKNGQFQLSWDEFKSNTGGRTRTMMFDPDDKTFSKVWAGSVTGGLWYNNNIFQEDSAWHTVSDNWGSLSVNALASDPNNTNIYYAGTGEAQTALIGYRESCSLGVGIYKTDDAGKSWYLLESTTGFRFITDIAVRNENGKSVIYAGVVSGDYKDQYHESKPSDGLFRSEDGGISWSQVLPNIRPTNYPYWPSDIEIASNNVIYVGTGKNHELKGGCTILSSYNGTDWKIDQTYNSLISNDTEHYNYGNLANIPGRTILASAQTDPGKIYALFESCSKYGSILDGFCYYLARSDDGGLSWLNISTPVNPDISGNWAQIAWHALCAKVDPNNSNTVYVGGIGIHRSTDGGNKWDYISTIYGPIVSDNDTTFIHQDHHFILFKGNSSDTALFANDGGVYMSANLTSEMPHYKEVNKGYGTLQFYSCNIYPRDADIFMGGAQDNGTFLVRNGEINPSDRISAGDGSFCFFDEITPDFLVYSMQRNGLFFSSMSIDDQLMYTDIYGTGSFINPMDYDYISKMLYLNATIPEINELTDMMLIVENCNSDPAARYITLGLGIGNEISAIRIDPYSSPLNRSVVLGDSKGHIYYANNLKAVPSGSLISQDLPEGRISCLDFGINSNQLFVTFSSFGVNNVWYTNNHGAIWQNKTSNLPKIPVRWIIVHPNNHNYVLLATEIGVWSTTNFLDKEPVWAPELSNFPNVRVDMLRYRSIDSKVLAATHGRGLFTSVWNAPLSAGDEIQENEPGIKIYPNPVRNLVNIDTYDINDLLIVRIINMEGSIVIEKEINPGSARINVESLAKGTYIITISKNNAIIRSGKIIKL
jgi:photosystem II stability/assembly factor-like uncharacterized protein